MRVTGVSDAKMSVGKDRKPFRSVDAASDIRLQPGSDGVRYQLIEFGGGNETISGVAGESNRRGSHSSTGHVLRQTPTKQPTSLILAPSVTPAPPESEKSSSPATASKTGLQLEISTASKIGHTSGSHVTTDSTYHNSAQPATIESVSYVPDNNGTTTDSSADTGNRKAILLLTVSGESRLRSAAGRSSDANASAVTVSGSREPRVNQSEPEVTTTESGIENGTDMWNVDDAGVSTAVRVGYVHTSLSESDSKAAVRWRVSALASISAACLFCLVLLAAAIIFVVLRRRRSCKHSKVGTDHVRRQFPFSPFRKVHTKIIKHNSSGIVIVFGRPLCRPFMVGPTDLKLPKFSAISKIVFTGREFAVTK